jgi:hypothetical protein
MIPRSKEASPYRQRFDHDFYYWELYNYIAAIRHGLELKLTVAKTDSGIYLIDSMILSEL